MDNYELEENEVILYRNSVFCDNIEGCSNLILTSKKMIFEQSKTIKIGVFKTKTEKVIVNTIMLKNIKIYNGKIQIQQKGSNVYVQTIENNFNINFNSIIEAMKFVTKITDTITETTISERGTEKIKGAFDKVDDVLGFNTRDTIKGVIENGITGTILKGIKKNK